MKSYDEAEAQARIDEILDEAQQYPIIIRRHGQDTVVVTSMADYERFRTATVERFIQLRNDVAGEAVAKGLTEEKLAELISRDDL